MKKWREIFNLITTRINGTQVKLLYNLQLIRIFRYHPEGSKVGRQVGLSLHNKYRQIHNAPIMQLSPQLNEDAQLFAETLAGLNMLFHDKSQLENKSEGENVGVHCSRRSDVKSIKKVVDTW